MKLTGKFIPVDSLPIAEQQKIGKYLETMVNKSLAVVKANGYESISIHILDDVIYFTPKKEK